jgi:hypothetical protein
MVRIPLALLVLSCGVAHAQTILRPDRDASANWKMAGLQSVGGIPNRTTVCARVNPSGSDDSSAIQTAINSCPVGQVVSLASGTFLFSNGHYLLINKGIILRGAGAGQTILSKTDGANLEPGVAVGSAPAPLIILGPARYGVGVNGGSTNLTADGANGAYSITVESSANFSVGQFVLLDEVSGAGWQPDVTGGVNGIPATSIWASPDYRVTWRKHNPNIQYVDDFGPNEYPYQSGTNGSQYSRLDRVTNEIKEIASIAGNTITFTSPLSISYRVSHTAQLTWYSDQNVKGAGIERLSTQGGDDGAIKFIWCSYCWAKNIENSIWAGQGVEFIGSFRSELREFYSHDAAYSRPGGGAYAIALDWASSEILVENSISVRANKVMVARASGAGSVFGYNYTDMGFIDYSQGWIEIGLNGSHFVGSHHILFEGNYGVNGDSDNTHGSSIYNTYFRNWLRGIRQSFIDPNNSQLVDDASQSGNGPRRAAGPMSYSYWMSFIGNVLGASGQMDRWTYEGTWTGGPAIWILGWGDTNADPQVTQLSFPGVIVRDGNWDWFTSSQKWHNTPAGFVIPNSLYLASVPAFIGLPCLWPWVDPTTGSIYTLPAKARFDSGSPNTPSSCESPPPPPPPPRPPPRRRR